MTTHVYSSYNSEPQPEPARTPHDSAISNFGELSDNDRIFDLNRTTVLTHYAFDSSTVRLCEQPLLAQGIPLMRMAAQAVAKHALDILEDCDDEEDAPDVVVFAGSGDNGGDGVFAAAEIADEGYSTTVVAVGKTLHSEAFSAFIQAGGKVLVLDPTSTIEGCSSGFSTEESLLRLNTAVNLACRSTVLIDAITGIGVHGSLVGIAATLCAEFNKRKDEIQVIERDAIGSDHSVQTQSSFPTIISVDIPSGVGVDDGTLPGPCLQADITVTFGALKPCVMLPPAVHQCGIVNIVDFGFDFAGLTPAVEAVGDEFAAQAVRVPQHYDSKYTRSVVGLITGSSCYPGAAVLSVNAAALSNVGMVRYIGPQVAQQLVIQSRPEVVLGKGRVDAWVVGSGVSVGTRLSETQSLDSQSPDEDSSDSQSSAIQALLRYYDVDSTQRTVDHGNPNLGGKTDTSLQSTVHHTAQPLLSAYDMPPICVDAGAVSLLPERVSPQVVLTPHAAELARLLRNRGENVDTSDILQQPWLWAARAHALTGATVLLKGAVTVIVGDDGEGNIRTLISGSGPSWLATAGSGDVLAGMVGSLLAQQDGMILDDPSLSVDIAASAAYLHGVAGQIASETNSCSWVEPLVFPAQTQRTATALGHPIVASQICDAIEETFEESLPEAARVSNHALR